MDRDERDRLDRYRTEHVSQVPPPGRRRAVQRIKDLWRLAARDSGPLRWRLVLGAAPIIAVLVFAIVLLAASAAGSGGGDKRLVAAQARVAATPAEPPTEAPTETPVSLSALAQATTLPDRQECGTIRGTDYSSASERTFYQQNCVEPTAQPALPVPLVRPTDTPLPAQPTELPSPVDFGAISAVGLAVDWITNSAPDAYVTSASSCNAVQVGNHWVVTCAASPTGCQGSACQTILSVCVFAEEPRVRQPDEC